MSWIYNDHKCLSNSSHRCRTSALTVKTPSQETTIRRVKVEASIFFFATFPYGATISRFSPLVELGSSVFTRIPSRFINMGMVFGKIGVETPKFELIQSTSDYEIRKYPPSVVAEVTYDPSQFRGDKDGGFSVLANYIGAFGNPQNVKPEKIAMTAPVITKSEKIAMTAPVVTAGGGDEKNTLTMRFTLPDKYKKAEEAPQPVDERVLIREEGERKYGIVTFGGVATDKVVEDKVEMLKKSLERDGFKIVGKFLLARYNPPWTLPPFRTNEVMIPVE